jgi:probable addiction module antidote protein
VAVTKLRKAAILKRRELLPRIGGNRMTEEFSEFDAAELIDDLDDIEYYLINAIETGDIAYVKDSLNDVARSKGMLEITSLSGTTGKQLLAALSTQDFESMESIIGLIKSMGLRLVND